MPTQAQLPSHQMQTHLAAGEQIELFIRLDELVGIKGPDGTRHRRLQGGAATLAESPSLEKSQSNGCNAGQAFSSKTGCAVTLG